MFFKMTAAEIVIIFVPLFHREVWWEVIGVGEGQEGLHAWGLWELSMGLTQVEDFPGTWWDFSLTRVKVSFSVLVKEAELFSIWLKWFGVSKRVVWF